MPCAGLHFSSAEEMGKFVPRFRRGIPGGNVGAGARVYLVGNIRIGGHIKHCFLKELCISLRDF